MLDVGAGQPNGQQRRGRAFDVSQYCELDSTRTTEVSMTIAEALNRASASSCDHWHPS
jgi:hypothetical protein